MDKTDNKFMIRSAEGRMRKIVDCYNETVNDYNPLFVRINGAPRCRIALHVTPTKNRRKKRDSKETQYLLQC